MIGPDMAPKGKNHREFEKVHRAWNIEYIFHRNLKIDPVASLSLSMYAGIGFYRRKYPPDYGQQKYPAFLCSQEDQ